MAVGPNKDPGDKNVNQSKDTKDPNKDYSSKDPTVKDIIKDGVGELDKLNRGGK
ncbi:hypothetical protein [Bradyrhizobium roseum]|uniref:hypothetical protein n=1 Tax=Bradyrhizobium roseum TaxID=3056648 RepID=UPI00262A2EA4|nr:hypothetical protein [Bradyrhizobium roseus]WKA31592.1 hypothetical protein QUH67_16155 [Bradyrhizobium roseus]